jgi:hypothetical protein
MDLGTGEAPVKGSLSCGRGLYDWRKLVLTRKHRSSVIMLLVNCIREYDDLWKMFLQKITQNKWVTSVNCVLRS